MSHLTGSRNVVFCLPGGFVLGGVTNWSMQMKDSLDKLGFNALLVEHPREKTQNALVLRKKYESLVADFKVGEYFLKKKIWTLIDLFCLQH